jgi:predicted transcriptional regulator
MPDKEHVARIVGAYVRGNALAVEHLPGLIATVHAALSSAEGGVSPEPVVELVPAVPVSRSVTLGSIICLDCGYAATMLKRHLTTAHGLTAETYRLRWNLKSDYPVVAPTYAARRREFAKSWGFGARREFNG